MLQVLYGLLIVVTVACAVLVRVALTGHGAFLVDPEIGPPYTVEFSDGGRVLNMGGRSSSYEGVDQRTMQHLDGAPTATAKIRIGSDDVGARLVAAASVVAGLGLTWLGVLSLRRIVRSAVDGEPFGAANVGRLRWPAFAVLAAWPLATLTRWGLDWSLAVSPAVDVKQFGPSWWAYLTVGLALLALAEVFGEGVRLREFEDATV